MLKNYITVVLIAISSIAIAENNKNIFLGRDLWKKDPSVETVKKLIQEGNSPTESSEYAFDAVCYSILENTNFETIKYLLSFKGNEVDKVTHDGRNYLLWAAYKGNLPLMKYLIKQGSDTKLVDDHGYNLMTFAAVSYQEDLKVFDLILENGGSVHDKNREGASAFLIHASHMKDDKTFDYFIKKGADLHSVDNHGNNVFHYAALLGNTFMMEKAVKQKVDYKKRNDSNENAMFSAAKGWRRTTNSITTFTYLSELGVEANTVAKDGNTLLHYLASSQKDPQVIHFFIKKGVDINKANEEGNTALLKAIKSNNEIVTELLLPLTKNVNHTNKENKSALTYAISNLNVGLTKKLIEKGADPKIVDAEGKNLMIHIFNVGSDEKKESIEELVSILKQNKVYAPQSFDKGKNLVHVAVEKKSPYLLEKALELKQDINQKNKEGLTPLHLAAMKSKDDEILKWLLDHGADKTILTDFEESAYDLASENELITNKTTALEFLKIN